MIKEILIPVAVFALLGAFAGICLAIASKKFSVKEDERTTEIRELLAGGNCGGCGFTGCDAFAKALTDGKATPEMCVMSSPDTVANIAGILGIEVGERVRMRAQVMCSGTAELAAKKYLYQGSVSCEAAAKLDGGDKLCPYGCIGLGNCAAACPFDAISIVEGIAQVNPYKCTGCGTCVKACPKGLIKLVPYDSCLWVGCMSFDKGKKVSEYCGVGCIGCGLCVRVCKEQAIKVENGLASIDIDKCVQCGDCKSKCPKNIIWSAEPQGKIGLAITRF